MFKPGSVLVYHPFATIAWCIRRRRWPWIESWLSAFVGIGLLFAAGNGYSHVVQCVGDDEFVHTRMGYVKKQKRCDFPPGYLETAAVLVPASSAVVFDNSEKLQAAFSSEVGRSNADPTTIPLAFVWRWLFAWGLVSKRFMLARKWCNCTTFVARCWLTAGHDVLQGVNTCYVGIYPSDFFKMPFFKTVRK